MQNEQALNDVFHALADGTRRAILSKLISGPATVNEIARPFDISQPAVSRHLKVLEKAGLIEREIDAQKRPATIKAETLLDAVDWLTEFRPLWGSNFDQLEQFLQHLQQDHTFSKTTPGDKNNE